MNLTGPCPSCGSRRVVPVVFGFPDPATEAAAARGDILLGGDALTPEALEMNVGCADCRHRWFEPAAVLHEGGSFRSIVEAIWSKDEPITFDELIDTAIGEVEHAFEDLEAPDDDIPPFVVIADESDAFLVRWVSLDPDADLISQVVPATLAAEQANMAALAITSYLTDVRGSGERREAVLVNCVAREGTAFRESTVAAWITRRNRRPPTLTEFEQLHHRVAPAISRPLRAGLAPPTSDISDSAQEAVDPATVAESCLPALQAALAHWPDQAEPLPMCLLLAHSDRIDAFVIAGSNTTERVTEVMKHFVELAPWAAALATEAQGIQEAEGREPARTWLLRVRFSDGDGTNYAVELDDDGEAPTIAAWLETGYRPDDFNEKLLVSGLRHVEAARSTGTPVDVMAWLHELRGS